MQKLKDTLNRAKKQAQVEFDAKIVKFMTEHPQEPHRIVAQWFGVHRNYVGKLSRNILGPRKRGRKLSIVETKEGTENGDGRSGLVPSSSAVDEDQ